MNSFSKFPIQNHFLQLPFDDMITWDATIDETINTDGEYSGDY
jgi:hypothetical protein